MASSINVIHGSHVATASSALVGGLSANQRAGREQVDRRIDLGDLPGGGESRLDEPLLGGVDEPPELEDGHVALDRDRRSLSRENVVRLLMGDLDGAVPRRGELRTRHQLADPVMDQPGHPVGQGTGQITEAVHELRSQTLRGQCIDRVVRQLLHVDIGENLGADPVGERGLDRRIQDHRTHRRHEAVGIGHLVVRPHRDHRGRDTHAPQHQQDSGGHRRPPNAATRSCHGGGTQRRHLLAQSLQLAPLVLVEHRGGDLALGAFVRVGHRRLLIEPVPPPCHRAAGRSLIR